MQPKNLKIVYRVAYVLTLILTLVTLFHYSMINKNEFTMGDFIENPAQFAGHYRSITGPFVAQTNDGFFIEFNKHHFQVYYAEPYTPPVLGEVSIYGMLNKDGSITAWRVHNYDYNYILYVLSFFAGISVILYFFSEWKMTARGFFPRRRAHA